MNTKNENNIINDEKLDAVTGGTITVNDFSAEMTASGTGDHCHFEQILGADQNTLEFLASRSIL